VAAIRVVEYLDGEGRSAYAKWFESLNATAAAQARWSDYRRRKA
jgi:hypothetical protein